MPETNPSLDQLIEANTGFVHALALRLAPVPGLAEDIAQQVFLEFIAKAAQWDLTQDIKPLLAGMTRNVARRCWRDKTREMPEQMRQLAEHIRELAAAATEESNRHGQEAKNAVHQWLEKPPGKNKNHVG